MLAILILYFAKTVTKILINRIFTIVVLDDNMTWRHFPHYCLFVMKKYILPVDSQHEGSVMQTLMAFLLQVWIGFCLNNLDGEIRHINAHATYVGCGVYTMRVCDNFTELWFSTMWKIEGSPKVRHTDLEAIMNDDAVHTRAVCNTAFFEVRIHAVYCSLYRTPLDRPTVVGP